MKFQSQQIGHSKNKKIILYFTVAAATSIVIVKEKDVATRFLLCRLSVNTPNARSEDLHPLSYRKKKKPAYNHRFLISKINKNL